MHRRRPRVVNVVTSIRSTAVHRRSSGTHCESVSTTGTACHATRRRAVTFDSGCLVCRSSATYKRPTATAVPACSARPDGSMMARQLLHWRQTTRLWAPRHWPDEAPSVHKIAPVPSVTRTVWPMAYDAPGG
eukprot:4028586-Prymnesium_polylepis.1